MTLRDKENESHEHPDVPEHTPLVNQTHDGAHSKLLIPNTLFFSTTPKLQVILLVSGERMIFLTWFWRNKYSEAADLPGVLC